MNNLGFAILILLTACGGMPESSTTPATPKAQVVVNNPEMDPAPIEETTPARTDEPEFHFRSIPCDVAGFVVTETIGTTLVGTIHFAFPELELARLQSYSFLLCRLDKDGVETCADNTANAMAAENEIILPHLPVCEGIALDEHPEFRAVIALSPK